MISDALYFLGSLEYATFFRYAFIDKLVVLLQGQNDLIEDQTSETIKNVIEDVNTGSLFTEKWKGTPYPQILIAV